MLKPLIAATAVLAIAGSSLVYAQQRFGGPGGPGGFGGPRAERGFHPTPADLAAFTDARIAALKAGLELTPDQSKNWPAFEQALRDVAQLRIARMQARQERMQQGETQQGQARPSPFDRLANRADDLAKTSAALKKVADTGAPLYASLTDEQKGRFKVLARMLRPHPRRFAFNEGYHGWRQGGHGFGGPGMGHGGGHGGFGPGGGEQAPGSQL
ncbi:MAG TPA: Spy/CpxP family protein refolding chaperone [Xanthobacteraceae bacterium]|nr:Spy/CpxP family protein refolding chaperone [Xanthobacteraceae bacterium]